MNLNMEIGKKKDLYPSKKSINLCYQEDVSTQISTVLLRVIFIAVIAIAFVKVLVIDIVVERNDALAQLEKIQHTLDAKLVSIQDYDEVAAEYTRYSYKVLVDEIEYQDRMDVLDMLESTVFKDGDMSNVSISGNMIGLSFSGLNLDQCAQLIEDIQAYEIVEKVVISNQTGSSNGTYQGNVTITLKANVAGGEQ